MTKFFPQLSCTVYLIPLNRNNLFQANFIPKNCSAQFLSAYFLFLEILNLNLTFAVCRKRNSKYISLLVHNNNSAGHTNLLQVYGCNCSQFDLLSGTGFHSKGTTTLLWWSGLRVSTTHSTMYSVKALCATRHQEDR